MTPLARSLWTCSRRSGRTIPGRATTARPYRPRSSEVRSGPLVGPDEDGMVAVVRLRLGERCYDLADTALVMGILNRTPDSFYDKGATFSFDKLLARAEELVEAGADILDVGGVKAGPGP